MSSIGGNPTVAGSQSLDNSVVEEVEWKESSNAIAQAVDKITLDGVTIWEKPDYTFSVSATFDVQTEQATISVTKGSEIENWKYNLNDLPQSSALTGNSATISIGAGTYTITAVGYRDGVQKASATTTLTVSIDTGISISATWDRVTQNTTLTATLGSDLTKWSYDIGGGEVFVLTGSSRTISSTTDGQKTVTAKGYVDTTHKSTDTDIWTVANPSITLSAVAGDPLEADLTITPSNTQATDKWQYKVGTGTYVDVGTVGTTTATVTGLSAGATNFTVRLLSASNHEFDTASDTATITANADITGTAVYDPITKTATYSVTIGEGATKWSVQANRQSDNVALIADFVDSPATSYVQNVTVANDGTYNVSFKSYVGDTHFETDTTTFTVATPFVEITSVVELTSAAPAAPTVAVGDVVGLMAYGEETEPYSQDSDKADFRYVVLNGIFDSVNLPLDPASEPGWNERTGKTIQELIYDYGVWTPGATGNKQPLDGIIASLATTSTGDAWHVGDIKEGQTTSFAQSGHIAGGTTHAGVGLRFLATIGGTTYTLGIISAAVFSGPTGANATPYLKNGSNSFWSPSGVNRNIQAYYVHEIEVIS